MLGRLPCRSFCSTTLKQQRLKPQPSLLNINKQNHFKPFVQFSIGSINSRVFHNSRTLLGKFSKQEKEKEPTKKSPYQQLSWADSIKEEEKYANPKSHTEYTSWQSTYALYLRVVAILVLFVLLFFQLYYLLNPGSVELVGADYNDGLKRLEEIELEGIVQVQRQRKEIMEKYISKMMQQEAQEQSEQLQEY